MQRISPEVRSLFVGTGVNVLNLALSLLTLAIVPKFISVLEFSYWQMYVFYASLTVLFHFGISDGLYIAQGGKQLTNTRSRRLFGEFIAFMAIQLLLSGIFSTVIWVIAIDETTKMVFFAVAAASALSNIRSFLSSILLANGRLVAYSGAMISAQVAFGVLLIYSVILSELSIRVLLIFDLLGRICTITLMLSSLPIRPSFRVFQSFRLRAMAFHARIGFPVLLSYVVNMLSTSSIRFVLISFFDLVTFGKISLMMGVVRLLTVFSQSFSYFLFPLLKRQSALQSVDTFASMQKKVSLIQSVLFFVYFPISAAISWWLAEYSDATIYLVFLIPGAVYEFRTLSFLVAFIKARHLQGSLLGSNLWSVVVLLAVFIPIGVFSSSLLVIMAGLSVALLIRSILLERVIERDMKLPFGYGAYLDAVLAICFVPIAVFADGVIAIGLLAITVAARAMCAHFLLERSR